MRPLPLLDAGACAVDRFLALEQSLLHRAAQEPGREPCVLMARIAEPALLLGQFQWAPSALKAGLSLPPVHRRLSGGKMLSVGPGVLAVALVVANMGDMLEAPIPPARFINRYVRGILAGLTRAGAPGGAHYFGRDFISAESQRLASVGQEGGASAGVLEAFIAVSKPLAPPAEWAGYPEHADSRAGGPPSTTLEALRRSPTSEEDVSSAVAQGIAAAGGCALQPSPLPDPLPAWVDAPPTQEDIEGWASSGVAEIPIGFMEGLVKMEGDAIGQARLRGDFIAPTFAVRQIELGVVGRRPNLDQLGPVIDAAFHQPGAFILGMNELRLFADALIEASHEAPA